VRWPLQPHFRESTTLGTTTIELRGVFLISHFLIAFAFLFVIIQSTGNFKKETRSCIRRLAYLPAVIPDFAFVVNTELGALSGKTPKSFFQLSKLWTLHWNLACHNCQSSKSEILEIFLIILLTARKNQFFCRKKKKKKKKKKPWGVQGTLRSMLISFHSHPELLSSSAGMLFPPLTFLNFSSLPILVSSILVGCNKRRCYKLYVPLKQWFCSNAR
jgi:hypothetical protein